MEREERGGEFCFSLPFKQSVGSKTSDCDTKGDGSGDFNEEADVFRTPRAEQDALKRNATRNCLSNVSSKNDKIIKSRTIYNPIISLCTK
jgi:hypothetical protein